MRFIPINSMMNGIADVDIFLENGNIYITNDFNQICNVCGLKFFFWEERVFILEKVKQGDPDCVSSDISEDVGLVLQNASPLYASLGNY